MAFTREDLAAYDKQPQVQIDDKANPFDANAQAATKPAVETPDPASSADDPASGPADLGDGTSDDNADPSTAVVDPDNVVDPAEAGDPAAGDDPAATPPLKKGSARERIQELADERDGYKEFGKHLTEQFKLLREENEKLRSQTAAPGTTQPAAAASATPTVEEVGDMPQLDDPDIDFDPKKLATKQALWMRKAINQGVQTALKAASGQQTVAQVQDTFVSRIETFKQTHKDWDIKVRNPALPQLSQAASSVIAHSEIGPQILYHIAEDLGLAQRIAKMSPELQAAKLGEITAELKLKAAPVDPKAPKQPVVGAKPAVKKSVSNAPPPPTPTPAGKRSQERDVTDPNLDMDDFARRHREGKNAARAASRKARGLG